MQFIVEICHQSLKSTTVIDDRIDDNMPFQSEGLAQLKKHSTLYSLPNRPYIYIALQGWSGASETMLLFTKSCFFEMGFLCVF